MRFNQPKSHNHNLKEQKEKNSKPLNTGVRFVITVLGNKGTKKKKKENHWNFNNVRKGM